MAAPLIHPNWDKLPLGITDGFSLEMTAKDEASLREAAVLIPAETPIAVTFLPGEDVAARIRATIAVRELGFEPMPHFSARRITSADDFEGYLKAVVEQAGVSRAFIVAGDPPTPVGPYFDTSALIATGAFERSGVKAIGIGGHPEGHRNMTGQECWDVLVKKPRVMTWDPPAAHPYTKLHAKVLIVDRVEMLVGSANFTFHGLESNLELGLRVRGPQAGAVAERFDHLMANGVIRDWS